VDLIEEEEKMHKIMDDLESYDAEVEVEKETGINKRIEDFGSPLGQLEATHL